MQDSTALSWLPKGHRSFLVFRAAQQEAESAAAEKSQQLRRLAAQEALLKHAFLQAVEAEKERLLLARERHGQGRASLGLQARNVMLGALISII